MPLQVPMHLIHREEILSRMPLRTGKWTDEEVVMADFIIDAFRDGCLCDCYNGTTLRVYLAEKLHCTTMRVSKRYTGKLHLGKTQYIQKGCASVERIAYFHAARSAFLQSIIPLDHEDTTPIEAVVFAPSLFPTGMSFNSSHMSHDLSYLPVTPLHTSTDPLVEGTVALISEMAAASSCPDNTLASAMDFVPDSPCSGLVEGTTDDDSPSPCLAEIGHLSGSPILCAHELGDEAYSGGCPDKHKHSSSDGCSGTATSSTMDVTDEKKDFSDQQSDLVVSTYGAPVAVDVPTDCGGGGCPREECEDLKRYLLHEMSQVTAQH